MAVLEQATPEEIEKLVRDVKEGRVITEQQRLEADVARARAHLRSPAVKVAAITALQLRAAAKALAAAPLAVPAAALAAWQGMFAKRRYEAFLMAEGERVWFWRNRTENERWFWEVFFMDRLFIPTAFMLAYLYLVPNNFLWAVAMPLLILYWQDGRLPTPGNLEWWLIMAFGLYGKCWDQVVGFLSMLLQWW
jgi:hypothetical protein